MTGTVIWFNDALGYGFIRSNDEQIFFVHYSAVRNSHHEYRTLNDGDKVRFEHKLGENGKYARNVRILH